MLTVPLDICTALTSEPCQGLLCFCAHDVTFHFSSPDKSEELKLTRQNPEQVAQLDMPSQPFFPMTDSGDGEAPPEPFDVPSACTCYVPQHTFPHLRSPGAPPQRIWWGRALGDTLFIREARFAENRFQTLCFSFLIILLSALPACPPGQSSAG